MNNLSLLRKRYLSGAIAAVVLGSAALTHASSHREAPLITALPKLDGTDLYMFRSYEPGRENYVTLIANYYPLQEPGGGPNYFDLETSGRYEIHVDNNGDSMEDITFTFDFNTLRANATVPVGGKNIPIPLVNAGPVGPGATDTTNVNSRQEYTLKVISGNSKTGTGQTVSNVSSGGMTFRKPLDNIGTKSIPNYATYADNHIWAITIPGCSGQGKVFVGQRQEGFAVNIGPLFDLVNLNPLGAPDAVENPLASKNITTLALEVPMSCLAGSDPVIGAWTTSTLELGTETLQVSRLGIPLINEVVIGLPDKDKFNSSHPVNDAQFADYVLYPTLPFLLELLFSNAGADAPSNFPRSDLVMAVGGVTGLNLPQKIADNTFPPQ